MATQTISTSCPVNVYTKVAELSTFVFGKRREGALSLRMIVGQELPDPADENYVTLSALDNLSLGSLLAEDIVYIRPMGGSVVMETIQSRDL